MYDLTEEKEFKKFADKHEQITFHQTINWGNLKKTNGCGIILEYRILYSYNSYLRASF